MNTIFSIKKNNNFNFTIDNESCCDPEITTIRFNRLNNIQLVKNNSIRDINTFLCNCIYSYDNMEINNIKTLLINKKKGINNYFFRVKNRDIFNENKNFEKLEIEVYNLLNGHIFKGNTKKIDMTVRSKALNRADRLKVSMIDNESSCCHNKNIIVDYKLLNDQILTVMNDINFSVIWITQNNHLTHIKIIKYNDNEIFYNGKYIIGKSLVLDNKFDCIGDIDALIDYTPSDIIDRDTKDDNNRHFDLLCDYLITLEKMNIKEKKEIIEKIDDIVNGEEKNDEEWYDFTSIEGICNYLLSVKSQFINFLDSHGPKHSVDLILIPSSCYLLGYLYDFIMYERTGITLKDEYVNSDTPDNNTGSGKKNDNFVTSLRPNFNLGYNQPHESNHSPAPHGAPPTGHYHQQMNRPRPAHHFHIGHGNTNIRHEMNTQDYYSNQLDTKFLDNII